MDAHEPIHYRPTGADRTSTPADVCGTCSNLDVGLLAPVSFCPTAARKSEEYYAYLRGGPPPFWLVSPDAARWMPA